MRYPRSFIRLLLIGFTLVALPLIGALVTSAIAVDRLANRSQIAVYGAVQATQSSRRLGELLGDVGLHVVKAKEFRRPRAAGFRFGPAQLVGFRLGR